MSEATVDKNIANLNKKIDRIVNKPKLPQIGALKSFANRMGLGKK